MEVIICIDSIRKFEQNNFFLEQNLEYHTFYTFLCNRNELTVCTKLYIWCIKTYVCYKRESKKKNLANNIKKIHCSADNSKL